MAQLTAAQVNALDGPGRYPDENGLHLLISPSGTKSWIQRVSLHGKRMEKGLGGYPKISLPAARKLALANKAAVDVGRNPWARAEAEKLAKATKAAVKVSEGRARVPTFREAARQYIELNRPRWKDHRNADTWRQTLEKYVYPAIGDMRLNEITRADVLDILTPLWTAQPSVAQNLRGRIRAVCGRGQAYGYITDNPAGEAINHGLPPVRKWREHHKAAHYTQVPKVMEHLGRPPEDLRAPMFKPTMLAIRFLILTAVRATEARAATWEEIDWDTMTWRIPKERMKAAREHRVPLSKQAGNLLVQARDELGVGGARGFDGALDFTGAGLLFPAHNGKPLGINTMGWRLTQELSREGLKGVITVLHGFRSSFRDWAAECSGASREAVELSLAHAPGGAVEMAYFRSDLLILRRELMQGWADYVEPL